MRYIHVHLIFFSSASAGGRINFFSDVNTMLILYEILGCRIDLICTHTYFKITHGLEEFLGWHLSENLIVVHHVHIGMIFSFGCKILVLEALVTLSSSMSISCNIKII